jgi:hypothetical protein
MNGKALDGQFHFYLEPGFVIQAQSSQKLFRLGFSSAARA